MAISLFYFVIYRMTRSAATAALTACVTMVSHSMWWHSTIAEVYALADALEDRHRPMVLLATFAGLDGSEPS